MYKHTFMYSHGPPPFLVPPPLSLLSCYQLVPFLSTCTGSFPEDSQKPFAGSTMSPVHVALALYGVFWAYDGWYVHVVIHSDQSFK